jgi:uncharacterized membrane protein YkvA (DUF1232 family)
LGLLIPIAASCGVCATHFQIKNFALSAGREVVEKALLLYYAAQEKDTPLWSKTAIFTALAYFICPIYSIPDAIPVAG